MAQAKEKEEEHKKRCANGGYCIPVEEHFFKLFKPASFW